MERYSIFTDYKINIVKMSALPKAIYRLIVIPIKILMAFFIEQTILNFVWTTTGTSTVGSNMDEIQKVKKRPALKSSNHTTAYLIKE